ncbi:MAG: two-component system sensor histidine kinase NtrB [Longimicrobiales bacterium]
MTRPFPLLRWLYLGRVAVAGGIFAGALLVWRNVSPQTTLMATLLFLVTLAVTALSAWHTFLRGRREPGQNFLYAQVLYDTLLVTAVVHVTSAANAEPSEFAPLYILVIAAGSLLLPVSGGVLIAVLASVLYVADIIWQGGEPPGAVFLQVGLFTGMALVTGALGDRLRKAGTQMAAVESELRQLRLDTNDILATIDTGVVTVDPEGRLSYLNPAGESILALNGEVWLGQPVLAELDRRAPGLGATLQRTMATGVPVRGFETWMSRNGVGGVLGVRTTALDREGTPWVTAVFQDITDGKRLEELHLRAERLEAVAELSASLAHEIKNPLASIRSSVEQLSTERLRHQDRGTLEALVLKESDRLSRLLADFIEFSRVELGHSDAVDFAQTVREAVELAERHPDVPEGAAVELRVPETRVDIEADTDLLHRAVFNLVLNGLQHAGPDGSVEIELRRLSARQLPLGVDFDDPLRLRVSDSGPGIPIENRGRVFDPFFTTRSGGTGLGLALVHRAVLAHEGAIFVDSGAAGGARFTVYLPSRRGGGKTTPTRVAGR